MGVQKSKPYPGIDLSEAYNKLQSVSKKLGAGGSYDKENFAVGMGYKGSNNGAFLRNVSALSQYGLIEKRGTNYVFTDVSQKILFPISSNDRLDGIRDAALRPALFSQLHHDFKGQELPELLPNILVNKFGILPVAKDKVVSIFRSSMEYAGLIDGNKLRDVDRTSEDGKNINVSDIISESDEEMKLPSNPNVVFNSVNKDFGEGRVAKISLPSDINPEERKKIITLIENL